MCLFDKRSYITTPHLCRQKHLMMSKAIWEFTGTLDFPFWIFLPIGVDKMRIQIEKHYLPNMTNTVFSHKMWKHMTETFRHRNLVQSSHTVSIMYNYSSLSSCGCFSVTGIIADSSIEPYFTAEMLENLAFTFSSLRKKSLYSVFYVDVYISFFFLNAIFCRRAQNLNNMTKHFRVKLWEPEQ